MKHRVKLRFSCKLNWKKIGSIKLYIVLIVCSMVEDKTSADDDYYSDLLSLPV